MEQVKQTNEVYSLDGATLTRTPDSFCLEIARIQEKVYFRNSRKLGSTMKSKRLDSFLKRLWEAGNYSDKAKALKEAAGVDDFVFKNFETERALEIGNLTLTMKKGPEEWSVHIEDVIGFSAICDEPKEVCVVHIDETCKASHGGFAFKEKCEEAFRELDQQAKEDAEGVDKEIDAVLRLCSLMMIEVKDPRQGNTSFWEWIKDALPEFTW
ncbi:MAG: hypothetical protein J6Y62_02375 [Clostridia bacterium]|nr:hypothetical protein [Clostridia bacterium]